VFLAAARGQSAPAEDIERLKAMLRNERSPHADHPAQRRKPIVSQLA
jgi:plasmid stability protein